METRQRRSFTDDYKRQAVDLVASSGRSIGSVVKELGLRDSVLRRWVEQRGGASRTAQGEYEQQDLAARQLAEFADVLDENGAERLLGRGHLVAKLADERPSSQSSLIYGQAPFLDDGDAFVLARAIA